MQERRDLYLIFKEAVNNLAKHSKATEATINFHLDHNTIIMVVADNGIGFEATSSYLNNGLRNMKERAAGHQWKLDIRSGQGAGSTITLNAQIA